MGVLEIVSGLANAAGQGYAGYGVDRSLHVKQALDQAKLAEEARRNAVLNTVSLAGIDPTVQGSIAGARASAQVDAAIAQATALKPIEVAKAVDIAAGTAPVQQQTHAANRQFDVENPLPVQPSFSFPQGTDAKGNPVFARGNNKTGEIELTDIGAKSTGSAESATIMKAKAANISQLAVIEDALKELDAHPGAVGLLRGLPLVGDRLDPRADPAGVAARAQIANIGSLKIHDRSGAAVSISEFPRLAPFIPLLSDPPEAIRVKLSKLRDAIRVETEALGDGPPATPPTAPTAGSREQQLWDAAVAKHGEAKVLQEVGRRPPA
jgi:hypothetical protein